MVKAKVKKENDVVVVENNDKTDVNQGIKITSLHTLSIYLASFYYVVIYISK